GAGQAADAGADAADEAGGGERGLGGRRRWAGGGEPVRDGRAPGVQGAGAAMSQSTRRRETGRAGRRARRARGLALVLVLSVLALVAILGSALLSSASLQARAASNGQAALAAECLAEGG